MFCKRAVFVVVVVLYIGVGPGRSDVYKKCGDDLECIEQDLVKHIDKIEAKPQTVPFLGDFVTIEKATERIDDVPRTSEGLFARAIRYLTTHKIQIQIPQTLSRNLDIDGRSSKLKKIILPLLVLLKLKAAIVIPAVLSIIALISFKGLGASLIALAIAGAAGLKSLLDNHHGSKLTYEVVPQIAPHWSRAGTEPFPPTGYHTIS